MTPAALRDHLQSCYFDNVDTANPDGAVMAFTSDVEWQHTQVWAHDGHDSRQTDRLQGREALLDFLRERVKETQVIQIRHQLDETVVSDGCGAFRGRVLGPFGKSLGFLGWVELRDGLVSRYIVVPEDFAAS